MIQNIEGINRDGRDRPFFSRCREKDVARQVQIQVNIAWPMHRVPRNASRTIDGEAIMVVIISGGDIYRFAGVQRECGSEIEPFTSFQSPEQIELIALVIIRSSPIGFREIAIGGEIRDPARVVVCLSQSVLSLPGEITYWPAAKANLERVALLICRQPSFRET